MGIGHSDGQSLQISVIAADRGGGGRDAGVPVMHDNQGRQRGAVLDPVCLPTVSAQ
jgi:hypothetical protein